MSQEAEESDANVVPYITFLRRRKERRKRTFEGAVRKQTTREFIRALLEKIVAFKRLSLSEQRREKELFRADIEKAIAEGIQHRYAPPEKLHSALCQALKAPCFQEKGA